jgi:hypothetical protein
MQEILIERVVRRDVGREYRQQHRQQQDHATHPDPRLTRELDQSAA